MSGNNYFKGWYFKCIGNDTTIAFIPAFHRSGDKETTSLQIITDDAAFNIPFDSLEYSEKTLNLAIISFKGTERFNISAYETLPFVAP